MRLSIFITLVNYNGILSLNIFLSRADFKINYNCGFKFADKIKTVRAFQIKLVKFDETARTGIANKTIELGEGTHFLPPVLPLLILCELALQARALSQKI